MVNENVETMQFVDILGGLIFYDYISKCLMLNCYDDDFQGMR